MTRKANAVVKQTTLGVMRTASVFSRGNKFRRACFRLPAGTYRLNFADVLVIVLGDLSETVRLRRKFALSAPSNSAHPIRDPLPMLTTFVRRPVCDADGRHEGEHFND